MANDIGVPAGLAGLFEPNQAEVAAAKLDRPFLVGAYGLDRVAGRGRIEEMAGETNAIKTMLAMRKMQQERQKDLLQYGTQSQVVNRFDRLKDYLTALGLPVQDEAVPGFPQSVIAKNQKPSGSINLGGTEEESRVTVEGDPGQNPTIVTRKSKQKVPGVPRPPVGAEPKAPPAAATPAPQKVPAGVQRGQTFRGTDGKLYRAE